MAPPLPWHAEWRIGGAKGDEDAVGSCKHPAGRWKGDGENVFGAPLFVVSDGSTEPIVLAEHHVPPPSRIAR